ncbi:PLP-dependent aminotransferase family protein [Brevibacillus sp. 1238]|uniref:MocR-like pyridoxine biosynthesis transcription factor PdxR n=1 Tax=Brevibacillus sp. 1238 TaxID=2940565 RepID=UPI002474A3E5|nr:PLP-dependent aminotransferase family protein [Brevibacillus sp. 1238]MDH6350467.1 GntR family transcriptional regulator/MocR family aminotransferase [Brevibacillus sp. 1238]
MLSLSINSHAPEPQYIQVYTQIRDQIKNGDLPYGSRLPSIRSLQQHMHISKTTVETAYQMLVTEGYVISKPRSGLYVASPFQLEPPQTQTRQMVDQKDLSSLPFAPGVASALIDFRPSAIHEQTFPFRLWRKMLHHALDHAQHKICSYGDPQGELSFRTVLASYLRHSRGVRCVPEQIVVSSGIQYSIAILIKLLQGVNHIAFEEPGYAPVRDHFLQSGYRVTPIGVDEKGISLDEVARSQAQVVYITPSHQFPTGSIIPYPERERLLQWARTSEAFIIEDDYDGEFRYVGKPIPSLQGLDHAGRVVYLGTFSKAFSPALRMSYMVLPAELARKLPSIQYLYQGPSRIDQWAMQAFMEQGHWYRHIRRIRRTYAKAHHRFIELLHAHLGELVTISGHNAGLHVQLTVKTREPASSLVKRAAENGVQVYDVSELWMTPPASEYPRIYMGFAGMDESKMEEGIKRLSQAWKGISELSR